MKIFKKMKDGGKDSTVTGYWLFESKRFGSVVLLKFEGNSREAYHTHAFNCLSWVIRGRLVEQFHIEDSKFVHYEIHEPSLKPFVTKRTDFHKVDSVGTSWVLSIRGPWQDTWKEYLPKTNEHKTLTHGRIEVKNKF